ncbi:MAG: DUF2948 family protein [Mesorhizobium sp.]
MDQLKLIALDPDDLEVIAAHVQDAVMLVGAVDYRPAEKRLIIEMNRFAWEKAGGVFRKHNERRRSVLHFEGVRAVRSSGIDRAKLQEVLSLLTIGFVEGEAPGGSVELLFAGDAALSVDVDYVEARLADLGAAWEASSRPSHGA